jgi:non-heme chloroperoxidase
MKKLGAIAILFAAILSVQELAAQDLATRDLTGDWQGTLKAGAQQLRAIITFDKAADGSWNASFHSIDQSADWGAGIPLDSITYDGTNLKFTVPAVRGNYEGKLAADGASIAGTWTQGRPAAFELRRATPETAWKDPSPHTAQFITVDNNVKLEVLDWGGSGRPLVLLTGLGNTAHIFDKFALKLTPAYHVYGITRRGYGRSSAPATGYQADRLGDDVLAVIDSLKLTKPILAGHSIAGEELSSIGSRHPEKVAGLIYLDAGYPYAFYDPAVHGSSTLSLDLTDLQKKLEQLTPGKGPQDPTPLIKELLESILPGFETDLREIQKDREAMPPPPAAQSGPQPPFAAVAILAGQQKYTKITGPVLAIFALPHNMGQQGGPAFEARDQVSTGAQAKAFETGIPSAKVIRLPHANHYVFLSNEADVLREMNAFIAALP